MVLVRSRHSPRGEKTGGREANNGSGTDWAVAVNEKANVKTGPHEKTIVAKLKQFLMPMGTTFRAGTSQGAKSSRAGFVQLLNHTKENLGRAYSKLPKTHASRDYRKDATASLHQTILGTMRRHFSKYSDAKSQSISHMSETSVQSMLLI